MRKNIYFVLVITFMVGSLFAYEMAKVSVDKSLVKKYVVDKNAGMVAQNIQDLTFLHTSDMHGYSFIREILSPKKDYASGGLFSLATLISKKRKKSSFNRWAMENSINDRYNRRKGDDGIFLVDCGDSVSGTYNDRIRTGVDITRLMNSRFLDYNAKTIGNHTVDYGISPMYRNIKLSNFPVVIANAVYEDTGKQLDGTLPYVIEEAYGIKVGFIGLSNVWSTKIKGVKMLDIIETLKKYLPEIRKKADIVVCLAHIGLEREAELVKNIAKMDNFDPSLNVDLFLDGHSHENIHYLIDNDTLVSQAGKYGMNCGEVNIKFNTKRKKVASFFIKKHNLSTKNYRPSQELKNEFKKLVETVKEENDGVVEDGLIGFFMKKPPRTSQYIYNPAVEFCARANIESPLGGSIEPDCSVVYHKSVRNHIAANDKGIITNGIMHMAVPFVEKLQLVKMKGSRLIKLIDYGMKKKYCWAGLQAHIVEKVKNGKLVERKLLKLNVFDKKKKQFVPVDKDKTYVMVCNSFFNKVYVKPNPEDIINTSATDKSSLKAFLKKYKSNRDYYFTDLDKLSKTLIYVTE